MVNRSRFKEPYKRARILAGLWEEVNLQRKKNTRLSGSHNSQGTGREAGLGQFDNPESTKAKPGHGYLPLRP